MSATDPFETIEFNLAMYQRIIALGAVPVIGDLRAPQACNMLHRQLIGLISAPVQTSVGTLLNNVAVAGNAWGGSDEASVLLQPGTYFITGYITIASTTTSNNTPIAARIRDATSAATLASTQSFESQGGASNRFSFNISTVAAFAVTTRVHIEGNCSANFNILAATTFQTQGNNATRIIALKLA